MPSTKSPSVVLPGPGRLAAGQVPASALSFSLLGGGDGDLGAKETAVRVRTATATAVGPVSSVNLPSGTFVGNTGSYSLDDLFNVVIATGDSDLPIYEAASANPIRVSSIVGATVGTGFSTTTITLNLSFAIPNGTSYRVYYYTQTTFSSEPLDVQVSKNNYWLRSDRVGFRPGNVNWANGNANTTLTNVQLVLEDFVTKLATTSGTTGSHLVGTDITSAWQTAGGLIPASTTVAGGLNDIVADLASTTSVAANGGKRVGTVITNVWKDTTTVGASNLSDAISEIVSDLASSTSVSNNGGLRIGTVITAQWANTETIAATSLSDAISEIVTDLADTTTGGSKVGATIFNTWAEAGGDITSSTTVSDGLNGIVFDLANTGTPIFNGATKIGINVGGNWADGLPAITAGSVGDAITEIVSDLAGTAGAGRVGVVVGSFSGTLTNTGGGGLTSAADDIQTALQQANNQVVARRSYTSVLTDATASVGGDLNAAAVTVFSGSSGGTYFFRRGAYTMTSSPTIGHPHALIGEMYQNTAAVTIRYTGGASNSSLQWTPKGAAGVRLGNTYENLNFAITNASSRKWLFADGRHEIKNCSAGAGILKFQPGAHYIELDIDGLRIEDDVDAAGSIHAISFEAALQAFPIYGKVSNLTVLAVIAASASGKAGLNLRDLGLPAGDTPPLIFETCDIRPSAGWTASDGYVLQVRDCLTPTIFRGCNFVAPSDAGILAIRLFQSERVLFDDCTFESASNQETLIVDECSNIHFKKCRFVATSGSNTNPVVHVADSDKVLFEDCYVDQQGSGRALYALNSTGVDVVRTELLTSPTTVNDGEIWVTSGGTGETHPIRFRDSSVSIRAGSTASSRRLAFNTDPASGTVSGSGVVEIDGLEVKLTHSSGLNDDFFTFQSVSASAVCRVKGLVFRLNDQTTTAASANPINFIGAGTPAGFVFIEDFNIYNAAGPTSGSNASIVTLNRAGITRGVFSAGTSSGNQSTFSPFLLTGENSYVEGMSYYPNDQPLFGRVHTVTAARCRVSKGHLNITNMVSGDSANGWFVQVGNVTGCEINDNRVRVTGTSDIPNTSAFFLLTTSLLTVIHGNVVISTPDIRFLNASSGANLNVISNNVLSTSGGVAAVALPSGADENVVVGNVFTAGTATISNAGTGNIVANNVLT